MRKRDYLADMSGQFGMNLVANLIGQLTYFYTDKVGLAVGGVGAVMLIAKIVDAVTDLWFGNVIDHSKGGNKKYYRWILRMMIPYSVLAALLFCVPIQAGSSSSIDLCLCDEYSVISCMWNTDGNTNVCSYGCQNK